MSLLDRIFNRLKNSKPTTEKASIEKKPILKDIIFDWFNNAGINVKEFEKNFFQPALELIKSDNYSKTYFENKAEEAFNKYFDLLSVLYLASKNPDLSHLKQLILFISDKDNKVYALKNSIEGNSSIKALKNHQEFWAVCKSGQEIIKAYSAIYHRSLSSFGNINRISDGLSNLKYGQAEQPFTSILNFVDQQEFIEKPALLMQAYIQQPYVLKKNSTTQTSFSFDEALINSIKASILKHNESSTIKLDPEIYLSIGKTILAIRYNKIYIETDYKKKKYLSLKDFPDIKELLIRYQSQSEVIIDHLIYHWNSIFFTTESPKLIREICNGLTRKKDWDTEWFLKLLDYDTGYATQKITPLFYNPIMQQLIDKFEYSDKIVKSFESRVFGKPNSKIDPKLIQDSLDIIKKTFNKVQPNILKQLLFQKYGGIYGQSNFQHNYHSFYISDNKTAQKVIQNLIDQLNLFINVSLKSISKNFFHYHEHNSIFKINIENKDYDISESPILDLNKILADNKTGYRLIPIPIKEIKSEYNTTYSCGIGILNYESFQFLTREYLPSHFPDLINKRFFQEIAYINRNAPFIHEKIEARKTDKGSSNNAFLNDPSWNWFKVQYIDKFKHKDEWYEVMDCLFKCKGSKVPNKKWLVDIKSRINQFGEEGFFRELSVMITPSIKDDFWFLDKNKYLKLLSGLVATTLPMMHTR